MTNNKVLSISDVSKMFDVDEIRVLGWINSRKLKAEKVDGVYQILEKELRLSKKVLIQSIVCRKNPSASIEYFKKNHTW